MAQILLVKHPAIPNPETPPTPRVKLGADEKLHRIVVHRVGRVAADVLSGPKLSHGLEVLVKRKIKSDAGNEFVRTIKVHRIAILWIAVENVAEVGRKVHVLTQPSIDKSNQAEITNVASRAGAALQLIEVALGLVRIPAIERNKTKSERVVRRGQANLGAGHKVSEARLAIQSINERSIRQVRRRYCKGHRHHNRTLRGRQPRGTTVARQRRAWQRRRREHYTRQY